MKNLAIPTPRQLEAMANISALTIKFIAILNQPGKPVMTNDDVSRLRDIINEIGYELNDLNTY
jgi:hypothetical protein